MLFVFFLIKVDSLIELVEKMGLLVDKLMEIVIEFNNVCGDILVFYLIEFDGVMIMGLMFLKINWVCLIIELLFYGYLLWIGVIFIYLGLKVDECVQCFIGNCFVGNFWVVGEIMVGLILGQGYFVGFGMIIGIVFGCIVGKEVVVYVN